MLIIFCWIKSWRAVCAFFLFCFNFCRSFDWAHRLIILIEKNNSKIWWNVIGSYLLSAQGRTRLVESLLSLLSPDLKGKHAFLLTFCNSLHGHDTIWLPVRKPEFFSVSLQKRVCVTCVFCNKNKKAEHSELIRSTYTVYVGPWIGKIRSLGCECVLIETVQWASLLMIGQAWGTCFHGFLKTTEKLKPLLIQTDLNLWQVVIFRGCFPRELTWFTTSLHFFSPNDCRFFFY